MKILNYLILIFMLCIFSKDIQAQSNNYSYTYITWLCDANNVTYYRIYVNQPGKQPLAFGNYLPNGSAYSPVGATTYGPCNATDTTIVNSIDSSYQYISFEMCDSLTSSPISFMRIYKYGTKISTGAKQKSFIGDFKISTGASYTPSANYVSGNCLATSIDTGSKITVLQPTNTTGTITQSQGAMSISILNVGPDTARITVNAVTYDLLENETWFCNSFYNEMNRKLYECPSVEYNCTVYGATTLHITYISK